MLRETRTTRHRCECATSVDCRSRSVESVHNNIACKSACCKWTDKATGETWLCASFRKSTSLKEGSIDASRKALLRVYDVAQGGSYVETQGGFWSKEIWARMQRKQNKSGAGNWKGNLFFNSLLTDGIRCGPTRELRLNPTRILKQGNLIKDAKKTKKNGCEKMQKNFINSLLTTAASDFKKNNNEVIGNQNKIKSFFFLLSFLKNPIVINKKGEPSGWKKNRENIKMLDALRTTCRKPRNAFKIWPRLRRGRVFSFY